MRESLVLLEPMIQLFEIAERYQWHTVAICLEDRRACGAACSDSSGYEGDGQGCG